MTRPVRGNRHLRGTARLAVLAVLALGPVGAALGQAGGADLRLTARDAPDPAAVGRHLTYTFRVGNHGPEAARAVVLDAALPFRDAELVSVAATQGSCAVVGVAPRIDVLRCELGEVGPGGVARVVATVRPFRAVSLHVSAGVASPTPDPLPHDDIVRVSTQVTG